MRKMVAHRILVALERAGAPICDDCLVPLAEVNRRQQVYSECELLYSRHVIDRSPGQCSICGRHKKVSWRDATVPAPDADDSRNTRASTCESSESASRASDHEDTVDPAPYSTSSMRVGEWYFRLIGPIEPGRDGHGQVREFMPQPGYAGAQTSRLHRHGRGPFCKFVLRTSVSAAGVYLITVGDDIMYVGECISLRDRFGSRGYGTISPRNCYVGGQPTNCKINNHVLSAAQRNATLRVWFHETPHRKTVESSIIPLLRPPWNH